MQLEGGVKFDTGKARYELIPPEALDALAALYTMGANKYGDRNWEKGMSWGRIFSALNRHLWAWFRGEKLDPTDGQHHLIAVAWNAFSLYMYELKNIGTDDRTLKAQPPEITYRATILTGPHPPQATENRA